MFCGIYLVKLQIKIIEQHSISENVHYAAFVPQNSQVAQTDLKILLRLI